MKQKLLWENSIFNVIKTFSKLMFPVITFAYAARILGETGIGRVSFSNSIISYFTMIALLGMNYYGTREAAKLRNDKEKLSKYVQEMLIINGCTTLAAYLLLFFSILAIPKLQSYRPLLLVNSTAIALNGLGMEWLYQALEEYRYITIRSIVFQGISFCTLFFFVRHEKDVIAYAVIHLLATSGSYLLNFINVRKYVYFRRYENYEIKKHLRPLLWLFAMVVSIELYTVLDSTMLGFLRGDVAVGRYTAAVKVNKMVVSLITSVGVVLLPRFSYYIHQKEYGKIEELVNKAYNFIFLLSIPCAVGLCMISDEIILIFSGSKFVSAGFTMRLLTPIVVVISFSTIVNLHTFVPMGKETWILQSTIVGAVTNFTLNLFLIPRYAENGAAVATVIAEIAVAVVCFWNIGKFYNREQIFLKIYQYMIASIPIPIIAMLLRGMIAHCVIRMCVTILLSVTSYISILFLFKNPCVLEITYIAKETCNNFRAKRNKAD